MKKCTRCGEVKPLTEFSMDRGRRQSRCRPCRRSLEKARWLRLSEERRRDANLKRFGITAEEYDALAESQGGVCAICGKPCASGRRLAVDHCHSTGRIRGLLCALCNRGLGMFRDNVKYLQSAIDYLSR